MKTHKDTTRTATGCTLHRAAVCGLVLLALLSTACRQTVKLDLDIDTMMTLAQEQPDSALALFGHIDRKRLSADDCAHLCLAYSWAQDRSGLDVADDSLLRVAYDYYKDRTELPYYARCMYYMGFYYHLVDSVPQAVNCLESAIHVANSRKDTLTECLASFSLARELETLDKPKAAYLAYRADSLYCAHRDASPSNIIIYKWRAGQSAAYLRDEDKAMAYAFDALRIAEATGDTYYIKESHQMLSIIYSMFEKPAKALRHSKTAYALDEDSSENIRYALIDDYIGVDSLQQAQKLLQEITPKKYEEILVAYMYRMYIAIKQYDTKTAKEYANQALSHIEKMYQSEMNGKIKYYKDFLETEQEKMQAEVRSAQKTKWIVIILVVSLCAVLFLIYKRRTDLREAEKLRKMENAAIEMKLKYEQRLLEQERITHQSEIEQRDKRIQTMHTFMASKISAIERIKSASSDAQIIDLHEDEWKELELFLNEIDNAFVTRLTTAYPQLAPKDIQWLMLIRLRLTTRELAIIYNRSEKTIKQRLFTDKARLGITNSKQSLRDFIEKF